MKTVISLSAFFGFCVLLLLGGCGVDQSLILNHVNAVDEEVLVKSEVNMPELLHKTLAEIVTENPEHAHVFEKFGLDFCCGGNQSLEASCKKKNLNASDVLEALAHNQWVAKTHKKENWSTFSISALVNHIVQVHHAYLKAHMPYISELIEKVVKVHGLKHPELFAIRDCYFTLVNEIEPHLVKEENVLFPMLQELDGGPNALSLSRIADAISVMELEHQKVGEYLATLRKLTNDFKAPEGVCNSYRILYSELLELEKDTHMHVYKENNVLFPKALDGIRVK